MTDTAEIMAKAMWANDADERPWATDKDLEGIYDRYRLRANVAIAAINAAGLVVVPKEHILALRAALMDGNADEAHRQLDAIILKESQ